MSCRIRSHTPIAYRRGEFSNHVLSDHSKSDFHSFRWYSRVVESVLFMVLATFEKPFFHGQAWSDIQFLINSTTRPIGFLRRVCDSENLNFRDIRPPQKFDQRSQKLDERVWSEKPPGNTPSIYPGWTGLSVRNNSWTSVETTRDIPQGWDLGILSARSVGSTPDHLEREMPDWIMLILRWWKLDDVKTNELCLNSGLEFESENRRDEWKFLW
jgi:hypothetical protein